MKTNEEELKLFLAKQLPEVILITCNDNETIYWFHWINKNLYKDNVKETEWLHICWLIEKKLTNDQKRDYSKNFMLLKERLDSTRSGTSYFDFMNASWQQRATALKQIL